MITVGFCIGNSGKQHSDNAWQVNLLADCCHKKSQQKNQSQ